MGWLSGLQKIGLIVSIVVMVIYVISIIAGIAQQA